MLQGFVWLTLAGCVLPAQSNLATVNGNVSDPQTHAVASAQIRIESAETGAARSSVSDAAGLFQVADLPPGEYRLETHAAGFAPSRRHFRLEVGQRLQLDLRLELGAASSTLEVAGRAELLKTEDASLGEVIETKSIQELPLNGRMLLDLALTVPGSHLSHGAQTGDMNPLYWRPGQPSSLSVGGSRPNANYFLIDGSTNTDPTFNTQNLSLSPDAVREFQVQTGSYAAELGGAGGGQINIVTRGGTAHYHGTAYEFLRNGALDARSFNEMPGGNFLVQNNYGAALGGPLRGKRTFFFANYEALRLVKAITMTDTVPTAAGASGEFRDAGVTIYNPFSAHPNPNYNPALPLGRNNAQILRDAFPNNQIPASLLSPVALTMLRKYVPRPNLSAGMLPGATFNGQPTVVGSGLDSNNYLDQRNERHFADQGTLRLDRVFDRGDSLSGRYSISSETGAMPQNLPGFGAFHDNLSQNANVSWNRIVSPSLVNTATAAYSRLSMNRSSQNNASKDIVSELGIQGIGFGGAGAYGAPWFNVQGYSGMGDSFAATPMHAWDTILEGRDALSWQHGRHALKVGGSFRRYIWPMWGFFQNRGYYQFTNGFTTRTATADGTGSALASFLLGLPAVRQRQAGVPSMDLRQWYADSYVQDTWRVDQNTTLEFGVRYEFMSPLHDVKRQWSNLLVRDGALTAFIGGQNGMPRGLLYPNKLNFAPRFGVSRQLPRAGIVVRAAYGIFYTPVDMNTWCNQLHNVPLVFPETNQSDNYIPSIKSFNFAEPVLGKTVVSFASFDPHAPAQYVQQWSTSVEKNIGAATTLEIGYQGARGLHLQRAHLINNALPGPGLIQPRRPYHSASFQPGTVFPGDITLLSSTFPVSSVNYLENSARSWYDAGYVNVRRRYAAGLSLLANYTYSKNLSNAPDFRSPMFESTIAQDNHNLNAEKGPSCDVHHRAVLSAVYDVHPMNRWSWSRGATRNWKTSAVYQVQSGFPFTVSVFGDTANAGTLLGENPIRANYTGAAVYGPGTHTADHWLNPAAFAAPPAYTFGNAARNSVYGPGMQTLDLALGREFALREHLRFQLRGEFFNALNRVNYGTPNRFVNTPQFGSITEAATPGREVQASARLTF